MKNGFPAAMVTTFRVMHEGIGKDKNSNISMSGVLLVRTSFISFFHRKRYPDRFRLSVRASLTNETVLLTMLADVRGLSITALQDATQLLLELRGNHASDTLYAAIMDFPEQLANEAGVYFVSLIDEFQELQDLNRFKDIKENIGDIFAFLRSRWQRHRRVNYIVAGSKLTMMKEILSRERAPLFQHFKILEIGAFEESEARGMLQTLSQNAGASLSEELIDQLLQLVGTNPFYLQVLGGELSRSSPAHSPRLPSGCRLALAR